MEDLRQGIVHIIGPEQGFTLPGTTIVCGDSHTSTHGAFGALAFGIGTSEVEHVLATQTLVQKPAQNMRITVDGERPLGTTAKDLILAIIGKIGTAGGTGHVIEYAGEAIQRALHGRPHDGLQHVDRGRRAGRLDRAGRDHLRLSRRAGRWRPRPAQWEQAVDLLADLPSDPGRRLRQGGHPEGAEIEPQVTWGTSPEDVVPVSGRVPDPAERRRRQQAPATWSARSSTWA